MQTMKPLQKLSDSLLPNGVTMPVLFVGHGNPMNAIETNEFSTKWKSLGQDLPTPSAILCISAHWLTRGTRITAMPNPRTIHDFGGFGQELFDVQYNAPGSPELAQTTRSLITEATIELDHEWGLDHGCWSVVKQMYPKADTPVLQLSIDYHQSPQYHYDLAKQLIELRRKGVLIIGSGNMVHNLRMVVGAPEGERLGPDIMNKTFGYDWALEVNETFKTHILSGDHQRLIQYKGLGKAAKLAIPTPDHYYPLLYSLALQTSKDKVTIFNDKCLAGSLSMTSVLIGEDV